MVHIFYYVFLVELLLLSIYCNCHRLRVEYPCSWVILAGDRNDLRVEVITSLDPTLIQLVNGATNKNGDKVLDIILTDCPDLLKEPSKLPPLQVDEGKEGKDSDHKGVQCLSRNNLVQQGAPLSCKDSLSQSYWILVSLWWKKPEVQ